MILHLPGTSFEEYLLRIVPPTGSRCLPVADSRQSYAMGKLLSEIGLSVPEVMKNHPNGVSEGGFREILDMPAAERTFFTLPRALEHPSFQAPAPTRPTLPPGHVHFETGDPVRLAFSSERQLSNLSTASL